MKRIFRHPLFLSLLLIAAIVFLNNQGWLKLPQGIIFHLISPGQKISYQASLRLTNFIDFLGSIYKLNQNNIKLAEENQQLLGRIAQLKETEKENEFLRKQMNLSSFRAGQLVLSNVIGQGFSSLEKSILIDKGEKQGIKKGMMVISAANLLVGRVIEAAESFSKVLLITDVNSRVNIKIDEADMTSLLRGDESGLIIDLIPVEKKIEKGQLVVTSGLGGIFPVGLFVGRIQKVISVDVQPFQKAWVEPVLDFGRLERVFVVTGD